MAIFAEWRLAAVAFLLIDLFVMRKTGLLERSPEAVAGFTAVVGFAMTGWFMGRLGGLDEPWFTFLTATPMFTVLILLSLRARFLLNFAIMGAAWLGYIAARPESLSHPSHGTIMTQYVFNCLFGIASGHITYMVLRANSAATARLESSRSELERFTARLESMVAERTSELRRVLVGAETVRDRERTWVVREIHDALGQELTALRYGIAVLRRQIGPAVAPNAFEPVEDLIGRAAGSVRRILGGLSSELPEHVPLPEAMEHMVREVGERAGLDVRFELTPGSLGRIDMRTRQTLYRIAQEATTNVLRHAGARTLSVRLSQSDGSLRLEVEDDGVGLARASQAGIGMAGIRHRAAECGGTASWSAGPSGGTVLQVEVPCPG
jgi:signal transduction histidine kinase